MWHIPTLKALKIAQKRPDMNESFINILVSCKRATQDQYILYIQSILLHKLYNTQFRVSDWIDLNFNQTLPLRQTSFKIIKTNKLLVGNKLLSSRLSILNSKIPLLDLNRSLDSYEVKYKKELLSNE